MDKKDEGGKGKEITRSGVSRDRIKKSTKMSRAISGNLVGVVPGNDQLPIPENFNVCWPKDNPCSFARIITC